MRLTVTSHLTLDGVMQSNGKPEPELNGLREPASRYVDLWRDSPGQAGSSGRALCRRHEISR
jgi:hypothetical protein